MESVSIGEIKINLTDEIINAIAMAVKDSLSAATTPDRLYTTQEIAEYLQVSKDTVRQLIRSKAFGEQNIIAVTKSHYRVTEAGVQHYIQSRSGLSKQRNIPKHQRRCSAAQLDPGRI